MMGERCVVTYTKARQFGIGHSHVNYVHSKYVFVDQYNGSLTLVTLDVVLSDRLKFGRGCLVSI